MKISNTILYITNRFRPLLFKLFPYEFLKRIKGNMIRKSFLNIQKVIIEPINRTEFLVGINLVGNINAETGLGQSCRLVADELEASGIPYSIYQYDQLGVMAEGNYQKYADKISTELPYSINLIHINPHELGLAFQQSYAKIWNGRYNIGFWLWELEEFPDEWIPCFHCLNEIWTPSRFISKGIQKKTDLPVVTIPYHIHLDLPMGEKQLYRQQFQLPRDDFLFLMMYDRTSMTERKNPKAVIDAYKIAFQDSGMQNDVGLVIKISNPTNEEITKIRAMVPERMKVYFITEILERDRVNQLIYCVDTVVSLHRAEGFGLVLAEAMLMGIPTIATNWSSNTEFMTNDIACMVDAKMIELKEDIGSFKKGNHWADPDVKQAAEYMKWLYENEDDRFEIAKKAKEYIKVHLGMQQAVECIRSRIGVIYEENQR